MAISPKAAAEIRRLMQTPGALRAEADEMRRSGGRGHYDPTQPRVPAGDPRGGQFAPKGYRGGVQFAQLGSGNPRDAYAQAVPFDGLFGEIGAQESLTSQNAFIQLDRDHNFNPRSPVRGFPAGRFEFLSLR